MTSEQNKANQEILDGLKKAVQAELDGHHFYKMASEKTHDPEGKEVFEALASDEMQHYEFLKAQYASLSEKGKLRRPSETAFCSAFYNKTLIFNVHKY